MKKLLLVLACALLPLPAQTLSGRRAPSFDLPDSTVKRHDILDYRGRWLLLGFVSTNVPHSAEFSRMLEVVQKQMGARVAVLSIAVTPPENTTTVANYQVLNKLTLPIVFDQGQVAAAYFNATPTTPSYDAPHLFVINPSGMIVRDWPFAEQTRDIMAGTGLIKQLQTLMTTPAKAAAPK